MSYPVPENIDDIDRGLRDIFQLHKTLLSDFHPEISPEGLNRTHWRTLMYISDSGSDCMTGIGRHVGLEAGSFTPVADRLIDEGLVERYPDPGDRRRILLRLTPRGKIISDKLRERMKDHFSARLSILNDAELGNLVSAMKTIQKVNSILQGSKHEC